jgi:uncharacterized protein YyaL (SSP411 family)
MHTNHLISEKSPYLLQHLHNPIAWYPWGEAAFAKARKEEKAIFLSVGYSTCHWCHVMAHESFENMEIAQLLNAHFVCIKVDREERPDVDRVYMTFVQATTGGGGWPMTVWLTPELKPFFGGTYFTPQQLAATASAIAEAWKTNRASIIARSAHLLEELRSFTQRSNRAEEERSSRVQERAFQQIASSFDTKLGGFGSAPKFPRPVVFNFLFHFYAGRAESEEGRHALEMTLFTLRKMAAGGIHDHLGGGFHRYAVDASWHVPHFEKMLYDQAQLATACITAYQLTREAQLEALARDMLDYVRRDMTAPDGGFYSAEDADSLIAAGKPEKAEGAFYVWTSAEIEDALGPEAANLFNDTFGIEARGNVADVNDIRQEFKGKNILFQHRTLAETAKRSGMPEEEVAASLAKSRKLLFEAREKRPRPHCDDKIITAWNGLMISAFARAAQVLDDPGYLEAATRAALFIRQHLYRENDRTLLRNYREGASTIEGFAEDYAFLIQGLLDLYEATFDTTWIEWAVHLQTQQDELFWDTKADGYFTTSGKDASILLRSKEAYDGAEPSANSVAALNLLRLSSMLDRADWRERARKTLRAFGQQLMQAPSGMPQLVVALGWLHAKARQIVIAGSPDAPDTQAMLREAQRLFSPGKIVLLADGGAGQAFLASHAESMRDVVPVEGKATAYVCEGLVCQLPTHDIATLVRMLQD